MTINLLLFINFDMPQKIEGKLRKVFINFKDFNKF